MIDMLLIENPNYRVLLLLDEFVWLLFSFFPDNFMCVWFVQVVASAKADPLKIMISGAPASGKGTQCELITKKVSFFSLYLF
jgi:hypothetical protein